MRILAAVAAFAVIHLFIAPSFTFAQGPEPSTQDYGDSPGILAKKIDAAINKVKPSLVRILVVASSFGNGREMKYETAGSGVIISEDGYVITNHHVAGRARQIVCTLSSKEEIPAELVGTDPLADVAVVKLRPEESRRFPATKFADSSLLRVGDRVLAMGSPLALSQSVTMGIVSNTEVVMPELLPVRNRFMLEGENVGSVVRWIGHDARIFGGNSGGPLVNLEGEIVGINEINIGISGAIPGNLAKEIAQELIGTGKVSRSWFGLDIQPLLRHGDREKGALIGGVLEDSPADEAGFKPGDVLLAIAGHEVNVRFAEEVPILNQTMMDIPIDEEVEASVLRGGKTLTLSMVSREREYVRPETVELHKWGMTARNLSLMDSKEMKRDSRDGVMVTSVRPGGACRDAEPEIAAGDVIVMVDDVAVAGVEDLAKLTGKITKGKAEPVQVLVTFDRGKERYLTALKLRSKKEDEKQGVYARKAWLPIATQVVTKEIAAGLGYGDVTGMRITRVYPVSGAGNYGFKVGDIITSLNGEALTPYSASDVEYLEEMVRQFRVGSKVALGILRGGETLTIEAVLERSPKSPKDLKRFTDDNFEFTVREMSYQDEAGTDTAGNKEGVLVESVSEGGWASLARLSIGDLVLAVDDKPIDGIAAFEKLMGRTAAEKPKSVVFKILRGIHTMFIEMEPAWPDIE